MKTEDMLIGALLRVPAQAIQRRLIKELNAAGFDELRVPHMAVLQFPGLTEFARVPRRARRYEQTGHEPVAPEPRGFRLSRPV